MRSNTGDSRMQVTGGPADIPPGTLPELFLHAVETYDKPDALKYKRGGAWYSLSHQQVYQEVRRLTLGLESLGLSRGDRVAILSESRPEWLISDFACIMAGLVSVPLYPMLPGEQLEFMLRDSEVRTVLLSTADQLAKVRELGDGLPALEHVVAFDEVPQADGSRALSEVLELGDAQGPEDRDAAYRERALRVEPEDTLTILYTSGTTGRPKGVVLSHDNLVSNVRGVLRILDIGSDDVSLSHLPLSHIFERMAGQYTLFSAGVTICYAESLRAVGSNLREVCPTVLTSVPRGFEKMYERLREVGEEGGPLKRRLVDWATDIGLRWANGRLSGDGTGRWLDLQHRVADRLVFSRLRKLTGGRARYFVSGGAPLNRDVAGLFFAAGLPILEGYGLTETSPVIAVNRPEAYVLGSVGPPIPGVEVAIAPDNEVLTRGPHVMQGYLNDEEATAEAIEPDGWFHTGDIGELRDGYLFVTDRKKELIKTSGGKYIAPQPIEKRVGANPWVRQVVLVGERRKFPALLVVPEFERLERWARAEGIEFADRAELVSNPEVVQRLERLILEPLSDLARFERPKKVAPLPRELTIEAGELTPTLKVKRRTVAERYGDIIDALYEDEG